MQIRELAALAGVSTRTIRHYHHVGALPEPGRSANGYRDYTVEHAVQLVRIRRLIAVGLSLNEIAAVLADDRGLDLQELLVEVESDLVRRQQVLQERLDRIAALRQRLRDSAGGLHGALDEQGLVDYFDAVREAGADGPTLTQDRRLLSLLDGDDATQLAAALAAVDDDPVATRRLADLYRRFDGLREDPVPTPERVTGLADDILASLPAPLVDRAREQLRTGEAVDLGLVTGELTAGQRLVVEAMIAALARP